MCGTVGQYPPIGLAPILAVVRKKWIFSSHFYEYLTLLDLDEWFDADDHVDGDVDSRFHQFEF